MNELKWSANLLTSSLIAIGSFFLSGSANAVILENGDFLILDAIFRGSDTVGIDDGIINLIEFADPNLVIPFNFVPPPGFGKFVVTNSRLGGVDGVAVGEMGDIQSFDLADPTYFTPELPIDTEFPIENSFTVTEAFQPFWTLNFGSDSLQFNLLSLDTFQDSPLSPTTPGLISASLSGRGLLISDNEQPALVNASAAFVYNPNTEEFEADGGLTIQVVAPSIPEPNTIVGLLTITGMALGLKGKKQV